MRHLRVADDDDPGKAAGDFGGPHRAPPGPTTTGAHDESGRGLALPDAVSPRRGVDRGPDSRTVWCEVAGPVVPRDAGRVTDAR